MTLSQTWLLNQVLLKRFPHRVCTTLKAMGFLFVVKNFLTEMYISPIISEGYDLIQNFIWLVQINSVLSL